MHCIALPTRTRRDIAHCAPAAVPQAGPAHQAHHHRHAPRVDNDKRALGCLHAACSTRTLHTRSARASLTTLTGSLSSQVLLQQLHWQAAGRRPEHPGARIQLRRPSTRPSSPQELQQPPSWQTTRRRESSSTQQHMTAATRAAYTHAYMHTYTHAHIHACRYRVLENSRVYVIHSRGHNNRLRLQGVLGDHARQR